jgi:hypothetical protein
MLNIAWLEWNAGKEEEFGARLEMESHLYTYWLSIQGQAVYTHSTSSI